MRVSLDASSVPDQPGGAGRYVLELARALRSRDDLDLLVVARQGDGDRWRGPGITVVDRAPRSRPLRLAWEQTGLRKVLDDIAPDVHHSPHYTMPERARLPRVVTVHDLFFMERASWHQPAKVAFFRRALQVAARSAGALVVPSASTAARLDALLSPRAPVRVIAHGVDHGRFRPLGPSGPTERGTLGPEDREGAERDRAALGRIAAQPPYVAFVGSLEPRKDVPSLIRAFDRVASADSDVSLVIAGSRAWGAQAVDEAIRDARHGRRVRLAGYVSEDEKAALLRGAAVVAYPSLEEGFGLPALEALACGAPLVTTSGSAMEEVAGAAALLVPAGDTSALAEALEATLAGGADVRRRRQLGIERAAEYTWEASAAAHVAAYHSVV